MKLSRKLTAILLAALAAVSLASCDSASDAASSVQENGEESYKIGVLQFATHASLDNCYQGLLLGLEEEGLKEGENLQIHFENAQNDTGNSDMIAKNMAAEQADLLVGIATPAAMSEYSAAKDSDIPVIFTAVSDPVSTGLVQSLEEPGTNCTGTSDVLPLEEQVKMIRAFLPDASKIGIIYTTSEPNSISQLETLKSIVPEYGFEIVEVGVTNSSEVAAAAATVVAQGADCINNFTDNNVVDNLSIVLQAANEAGIPVFGSEVEQVKNGCLASQSIDYIELGKETGRMAARVLRGEPASEIPVFTVEECSPVYNGETLAALGLTLPEEYADAQDVSTEAE